MSKTESIEETVRKIILRIIRKPGLKFSNATNFKEMKADSLDIVQIIVAVEDTFSITIKDEDMRLCANIGDFIGLIERTIERKTA